MQHLEYSPEIAGETLIHAHQEHVSDFKGPSGSFAKYGKRFQEQVLVGLLTDTEWAAQMFEVMRPDFFDIRYLEFLADRLFSYFQKYKCFPSIHALLTIIRDDLVEGNDIVLREQIVEFLHRFKSEGMQKDLSFIKDKALDFCKRQAFRQALEQAVVLIDDDRFEYVVSLMKEAVQIGMPHSVGHDFFDDIEARFQRAVRKVCPTGLKELDDKSVMDGGLGKGEIGVVLANTGVGKSHWLVAMGAAAMRAGKNVLHYSFELSEHAIGLRYDSHLCKIPIGDVETNKGRIKEFYESNELGRLIIKEYPTGSASVMTLRNHIEKLKLKNFIPNLIIVDYADIMRSTREFDSLRHELKLIYEELRNLAGEIHVPIWTASQANRDSANAEIVGLENMGEAYSKAQVADVVISLSRKSQEKAQGTGRLFVAKNRAGRDGIVFPLGIDTSMSTFTIVDPTEMTLGEAMRHDDAEVKNLLKQKWQKVQQMSTSTQGD
jgi:replicative DNA helicase